LWMGNRGFMLLSVLVSVYFSDWVSHGPGCDRFYKLYTDTDGMQCRHLLIKSKCLIILLDFTACSGLSVYIRVRICLLHDKATCPAMEGGKGWQ
jgi:hypothetical protein